MLASPPVRGRGLKHLREVGRVDAIESPPVGGRGAPPGGRGLPAVLRELHAHEIHASQRRDFRVGIVRMPPVVVRPFLWPLAIEARYSPGACGRLSYHSVRRRINLVVQGCQLAGHFLAACCVGQQGHYDDPQITERARLNRPSAPCSCWSISRRARRVYTPTRCALSAPVRIARPTVALALPSSRPTRPAASATGMESQDELQ